jgi:hypothetical protein
MIIRCRFLLDGFSNVAAFRTQVDHVSVYRVVASDSPWGTREKTEVRSDTAGRDFSTPNLAFGV